MRVLSIYLETTIFNFPFVDDAPQYRADTLQLFAEIKAGKFRPFTSEYVTQELNNTNDSERLVKMTSLIPDYNIAVLSSSSEVKRLADLYVVEGVIPKKHSADAFHIAAA